MQSNYNRRFSSITTLKRKLINFFLIVFALFIVLFLLSKFNFPAPKEDIKKNITNEIIKLK